MIYGNHATADIEGLIRRSEIELADYELKQGCVDLGNERKMDQNVIDKVIRTICAIANNGPNRAGKIIIGVTDKKADADRITALDKITPKKVGKRFVVGVNREAKALGKTVEEYLAIWKNEIKASQLSATLRDSVLTNIDFNDFYGLGAIVITVPPQHEISWWVKRRLSARWTIPFKSKPRKKYCSFQNGFDTDAQSASAVISRASSCTEPLST